MAGDAEVPFHLAGISISIYCIRFIRSTIHQTVANCLYVFPNGSWVKQQWRRDKWKTSSIFGRITSPGMFNMSHQHNVLGALTDREHLEDANNGIPM
jgi:hypothetical protein